MTLVHVIVASLLVIFNHHVAPGRNAAIRTGWNDTA
jgi:hypothetical protein